MNPEKRSISIARLKLEHLGRFRGDLSAPEKRSISIARLKHCVVLVIGIIGIAPKFLKREVSRLRD